MTTIENYESLNDFDLFYVDRDYVIEELWEEVDDATAQELSQNEMFVYEVLSETANIVSEYIVDSQIQAQALPEAMSRVLSRYIND